MNHSSRNLSPGYRISIHTLDVNTKYLQKVRKQVSTNPDTQSSRKYAESFHEGELLNALAKYTSRAEYRQLSPEKQEIFLRVKAETLLGADTCARSADLAGSRWNDTGFNFRKKNGTRIPTSFDPAHLQSIRTHTFSSTTQYWDTKMDKGRYGKPAPWNRIPYTNTPVTNPRNKDTVTALVDYAAVSNPRRAEMQDDERDFLFISTVKCKRRTTKRKGATGTTHEHTPHCGGKCGRYHPIDSQTIAKDRVWAMKLAGVDTKFTAHACRGNAEMCIIHGSQYSDRFKMNEARLRARHSEATLEKFYARPPHPQWMAAVMKLPEKTRKHMLPEEYIRLR